MWPPLSIGLPIGRYGLAGSGTAGSGNERPTEGRWCHFGPHWVFAGRESSSGLEYQQGIYILTSTSTPIRLFLQYLSRDLGYVGRLKWTWCHWTT